MIFLESFLINVFEMQKHIFTQKTLNSTFKVCCNTSIATMVKFKHDQFILKSIYLTIFLQNIKIVRPSRNGGNDCSTCTLVTALVSQYSQRLNVPGSEGFEKFCELMPSPVPVACKAFLFDLKEKFNLDKITELSETCSPDDACQAEIARVSQNES